MLAELCPDVPDLDQALAGLVRAQILRVEASRLSSEQGRYQFVQSAVRQVAYGTLSRRERKQAHLDVLTALLRAWSDELAPVVAQHCIAAVEAVPDDVDADELRARAVGYLGQAATRARSLGSPKEAVGHLVRALELVSEPAEKPGLELALAEASFAAGHYEESIARARSARAGFATRGDVHQEAVAAAQLADSLIFGPADYEAALGEVEPHYRRLTDSPDDLPTLARILWTYNTALARLRRSDVALTLRHLTVADRLGDQSQIASALIRLSVSQLEAGGNLLGVLALEKAVAVARDAHDLVNEAHALANWSSYLNGHDARRALEVGHQAVEVATRGGNVEWISLAQGNLALARWALGEWDDVLAAPELEVIQADDEAFVGTLAGLVLAARGQDPSEKTTRATQRAATDYWWMLGRAITRGFARDPEAVDDARVAHDGALAHNQMHDDYPTVFGAVMDLGLRYRDDTLLQRLETAVDGAGGLQPAGVRSHRALLGALSAGRRGSEEHAETLFAAALREYDAWGSPVFLARARAAYGTWLTKQGRHDEAAPLLQEARATFDGLGAVAWLAELDRELSGVAAS